MADQEDEDLQMALRMSLQPSPPDAKRSKPPRENVGLSIDSECLEESPEARNRRVQRELMASAAEKRILVARNAALPKKDKTNPGSAGPRADIAPVLAEEKQENLGEELSATDATQLFLMLFGSEVSRDILMQWSNQGIRFSSDPETCMGLVQHEGGPCGVLATLQAFVLKYLLFSSEENRNLHSPCASSGDFSLLTEDEKTRALILSMVEILFSCGNKRRALVATLNVSSHHLEVVMEDNQKNEMIAKALDGLSIETPFDLQRVLRVSSHTSQADVSHQLQSMLPVFRSRMGAMLFLISALLSRGLETIQADRDDPSLPLVTAPFGHASQEIVNLLLCGQAAPNVFDGRIGLEGGLFLKGIPTTVEVGFLTLLESLNLCKVGQYLKCPKWPIWVVGSESHYTVLFALDSSVQEENELEARESLIRRAFDAQDQSGGGGFIGVEGLQRVLRETNINMPAEKVDNLCSTGFIVWSEFWQLLLELDKSLGGMKDSTGLMGKKQFDLYHFNGIAKSVHNGSQVSGGEIPLQRPRLSKLRVLVPPKWTPEEFMADVLPSSNNQTSGKDGSEVNQPEPSQHAPLVDCIRTRWPRAICNWVGDPPSIV